MKAMPFQPPASTEHERLLPFPRLPEVLKTQHAVGDLALRVFGLYESDLNVDFECTPRPVLVTNVLECCARGAEKERGEQSLFWHLPVGKRIECLLTMLPSGTTSGFPIAFRCPNSICGETSEIEISLEELAALQEQAYATDRIEVAVGNEVVALRRPTGSDQLVWLQQNFMDSRAALQTMVRTLLLDDTEHLDDEWLGTIEQAMEEHDPLVNFTLRVKCPACESEHLISVDLEDLSLQRLRKAQLRLLASVHRFAAHYHWSEQQVFAVPFWRRAHYLSLIEAEQDQ